MPTLSHPFKAPADSPRKAIFRALSCVLSWVFGCRHGNLARPYSDHQTCLDCGARREYRYVTEGIRIGKWRKAAPLDPWRVDIADTIRTALAEPPQPTFARPHFTTKATCCRDCGLRLDRFGACPAAQPMDLVTQTAPVFCGAAFSVSEFQRVSNVANRIMDRHEAHSVPASFLLDADDFPEPHMGRRAVSSVAKLAVQG